MILLAVLLLSGGTVADLDAELRAATSATAILQERCATPIRAEVDRTAKKAAPADVRADLGVGPDTPLVYRLVRLTCDGIVYSRAENWYRPDRLTGAINQALLSGDTPFGVAIRPLAPTRRTLESERPHEAGAVLRHRALVLSGEGVPLAEVVETYTDDLPLQGPAGE